MSRDLLTHVTWSFNWCHVNVKLTRESQENRVYHSNTQNFHSSPHQFSNVVLMPTKSEMFDRVNKLYAHHDLYILLIHFIATFFRILSCRSAVPWPACGYFCWQVLLKHSSHISARTPLKPVTFFSEDEERGVPKLSVIGIVQVAAVQKAIQAFDAMTDSIHQIQVSFY